jgi:organic radical activating enzyme
MLLHGFVHASWANGPGLRAVVYFQGCPLGCEGCWNGRSHKFDGPEVSTGLVAQKIDAAIRTSFLEGVTFSGGEPMQQSPTLVELMHQIRALSLSASMGMFTGYSEAELDSGRYATRPNTSRMVKIFKCAERSRSSMMDVENEHNHMRAAFGLRYRFGKPATPAAE